MSNIVKCFFAYSARPSSLAETVELAINAINTYARGQVIVRSWRSLQVEGKPIIHEVCSAIDDSDLFACDLTELSMNVLFEVGYAIARNKRIWVALDSSYPRTAKNFERMSLLSSIGRAPYRNSRELCTRFYIDQPYLDLESTIVKDLIRSTEARDKSPALFYLKSEVSTDASLQLTRYLEGSELPLVLDDPEEVSHQPLAWYLENVYHALAVVAHLIDERRESESSSLRNAKYALVSGMAYGFGKPLLMLAHAPYSPPVDCRDFLRVHNTARECLSVVGEWLPPIKSDSEAQRKKYEQHRARLVFAAGLQRINIGEYIAEPEENQLARYFVETAPYNEALRTTQYTLYVGRRGSGKTANALQLANKLLEDKRNHVCTIRPIDYELEGVLRLLTSSLSVLDPGYLIESLWKYLIYTELGLSIYGMLQSKPPHYTFEDEEIQFMRYVDENQDVVKPSFTVRLENALQKLCQIGSFNNVGEQRAKVSEVLHAELLSRLREHLGRVLREKNKVFVLLDNLDKAWKRREDLTTLAEFLFGLLGAGQVITDDFQKDRERWPGVNLVLIVFLRSDIFSFIRQVARERDKITYTRMDWEDPLLLRRVIEERFASSLEIAISPDEIWERYFVDTVKGIDVKDYIVSRIMPRPRDIIFFCKSALSFAINHIHAKIEEGDILQAEKEYSDYAFNSLASELGVQFDATESLLIQFVGADEIVTSHQMKEFLAKAKIPEGELKHVLGLLCDYAFLGLETAPEVFEFLYSSSKKEVLQMLAQRTTEKTGQRRFRINTPFQSFLEIKTLASNH